MSRPFIALCCALALLGCGADSPSEPAHPPRGEGNAAAASPEALRERLVAVQSEITRLRGRPWIEALGAVEGLNALQRQASWHVQVLREPAIDDTQRATRLADARRLLETLETEDGLIALLGAVAPVLDRLTAVGERMGRHLEAMEVPEGRSFPLRERWETVVLAQKDRALRLLAQGLATLGEEDDAASKIRAGTAQLGQALELAEERLDTLSERLAPVRELAGALHRLEAHAAWVTEDLPRLAAHDDSPAAERLRAHAAAFEEAWIPFEETARDLVRRAGLGEELEEGAAAPLVAEARRLFRLGDRDALDAAARETGLPLPPR